MVVFGQSCCVWTKVEVFGQSGCLSGESGCIRAKVVVFAQSGCIRVNLLFSGKTFRIQEKVIVFRQKWLYSGKYGFFRASGFNR